MSSTKHASPFVSRFDRIWAQARRVQVSQALCWAVLTALVGVAGLVAVDYAWELPRIARMAALVVIAAGSAVVGVTLAIRSVQRWQRQATAAAIEEFFPQLGQRIRTTVQYGELSPGEIEEEGVATTLVGALEQDTVERARPLPLDAVVPWKRLALASLLAAAVGLGLAGASAVNWEWRTAAQRTLLGGEEVYTKITVEPGDLTLREGESATVRVTVEGRTDKALAFWSRRTDGEGGGEGHEWVRERLRADDAISQEDRLLAFDVPLDRVRHPLEYRVTAGTTHSDTYRVNVLYPLKSARLEATLKPPAYTRQPEQVTEGGQITGLAGSQVKLRIELDRPAQTAWLEVRDVLRRREAGEPATKKLELAIDGKNLTTAFELTADQTFSVLAQAADGMELPENKHRIRIREDEPPRVWFESPSEALEVHSLAEILMRVRVTDDFGLTRAGIMFEVNNEEEYPLPLKGLEAIQAALKEAEQGKGSPQLRATLEGMLPLELFNLTQQDSVMYYAFAEDNREQGAQRTESELRFIDIRPFRRLYRVFDAEDGMMMNQGPQLKSLEELIARQRYALNRTIQLARLYKRSGQADLAGVDALIKFEGELARFTRELAQGLEARGIDETELLYQAETAMLAATDSLQAGNYDTATLQQRDALKYLIEGRNRIQMSIAKNPDRRQLAQLRQFDRTQQQKLRRPKTDEEEAREVAERLEQLANEEDFVYKTLAGTPMPGEGESQDESEGTSEKTSSPTKKREDAGGAAEGSSKEKSKDKRPGSKEAKSKEKEGGAEDSTTQKSSGEAKRPSPRDIEDRQLDIAEEAKEVDKALQKLKGITDLAKERMTAAIKSADDSANALSRGAKNDAQTAAKSAGAQFRELAAQVRALIAQEQAERIAAAQQMAQELARQQEDFVDRLANKSEEGGGGGEAKKKKEDGAGKGKKEEAKKKEKDMPGLGSQAEKIAERAKTLADVLAAAAKADNPDDQASADKVKELVGTLKLPELTERLQKLPDQVSRGKLEEAKATAGDGQERMEAAAEQLAAIHRAIIAPKLDELAKVGQRLAQQEEELDRLDAPARITAWHMDTAAILEELDKLGISKELRDALLEEMRKAGWGPDLKANGWKWGRTEGGYYLAPVVYRELLSRLRGSIHDRMQELLKDVVANRDEPVPPQYQELVDRHQRLLSSEGREGPKRMKQAEK